MSASFRYFRHLLEVDLFHGIADLVVIGMEARVNHQTAGMSCCEQRDTGHCGKRIWFVGNRGTSHL